MPDKLYYFGHLAWDRCRSTCDDTQQDASAVWAHIENYAGAI